MVLVDNELRKREESGNPVRVALVGAGAMGKGIANQIINYTPGVCLVAIASRTIKSAKEAYKKCGIENAKEATSLNDLEDCIQNNTPAITSDAFLVCQSENIDLILEAVGLVEFGIELALKAFENGKDLLTMNAEMDATVGLAIKERAQKAGVVYSVADGDQPGVQMTLFRQVRTYGLTPLVCGNIKGLQDKRRTPETQAAFAKKWNQDPYMVTSFADGTKISFEQACVANATGMKVEMRGMRGGDFEGHIDELCHNNRYDLERINKLGGVVDYVVKSRPAPGVFVFGAVQNDDFEQRHHLNLYKLGEGPLYSFYIPYHLCIFEAASSIGRVACFKDSVLKASTFNVDVISLAKKSLKAGETLDALGGFATYGECENYNISKSQNLLPIGAAQGCRLKNDIPEDQAITYDDVILPKDRLVDQLRQEQEQILSQI
ncbi:3-hydroxyacyl-CoA dehydrogenase NAD-binding domain-containing protein [Puniceicoccaceae bacterium K14]|nr:3-hydroxyacyl-CoA dehydrogenase NAD-binding domain-containing protein [Puniceicoccaceae bacterium K14]